MTTWYQVTLSVADSAADRLGEIQGAFDRLFTAAGSPRTAALFASGLTSQGDTVCYFSPDSMAFAHALVATYEGRPCNPPPPDVALLVGHGEEARGLLQ
jgi:hypothetical protein